MPTVVKSVVRFPKTKTWGGGGGVTICYYYIVGIWYYHNTIMVYMRAPNTSDISRWCF